ncbi:MAG: PKD domain-containing protein [Bacteroidales bacterium]|jgi:PKD repeat protein|nr:PKD domain-containing protein [Bacteroidales bacterium]
MKTILRPVICLFSMLYLLASFSLFAQKPNFSNQSLQLNLFDQHMIESRFQLLAALKVHPQLHFEVSETAGTIVIKGNPGMDSQKTVILFEQLQNQLEAQFNQLSKYELADAADQWKSQLSKEIIEFALADHQNLRGDFCAESDPFCTGEFYSFPAGVNSGFAEPGPNYGCLKGERKNPVWYHMRILQAGDITIEMVGTKTNGSTLDIDFALWGPFSDPVVPCPSGLTANCTTCPNNTTDPNFYPSGNLHDCSYSIYSVENAHITNGQVGQYYILLILNFGNAAGTITFQKTAGTGETDCSIMPPPIGSNSPICVGETLQLYADNVPGASYSWTGPNGFTSTQQNPVINNVTMANAGVYSLIITVGATQSNPVEIEVVINPKPIPDFSFTTACFGEETVFTDLSTVNPPSSQITAWQWAFGDGTTSNLQNPSHTYAVAGNYQVTLTTYTGQAQCAQDITKQVMVKMAATVNAGPDQTIFNGWTAALAGTASGGSGNYSIQWTPANLLQNPTSLQTNTLPLTATKTFTLTVTDNSGGCINEDQVVITVQGAVFAINATAGDENICPGESTQLHANATGGSGNYTYSWTSNPTGFTSNVANPTVSPTINTTYLLSVFDGQNTLTDEVFVQVGPVSTAHAGNDQTITTGWTTQLNGSVEGGSGNITINWQPANKLEVNNVLNPTTLALVNTTIFTLTITDNVSGCVTSDQVTISTTGGVLSVNATANPATICAGESSMLSATASGGSGNYTYLWTTVPPSSWQATTAQVSVNPTTNTTYKIVLNDGQNIVEDQVTVTVGAVTLANAGPDIIIPENTTTQLQGSVSGGSGSYSVLWSPAAKLVNATVLQPQTLALMETQIFELTITDNASGCQTEDEMTVIVSGAVLAANPTANPAFVCPGESSQLNANATGGSGNYSYSWTSNPSGFNSQEANPEVTPTVTTTYNLSVSDGESQVQGFVTVTVGALSIADAGLDQEIDYGWTTMLTGSVSGDPNYTFSWTPANFLSNPESLTPTTVPLQQNRTFTLNVSNLSSGCNTSDQVQINITGGPLGVQVTADANVICSGTQVQLNANTFGGSGEYTYSWSSSNTTFTSTLPNPVVEPMVSTTYTLLVSDGMNSAQDQITITVNPSPVANAGANQVINVGTYTTLNGSATEGSGNFIFIWSPADSLQYPEVGYLQPRPQTKLLYETTGFTLNVNDLNGCSDVATTTVITGGDQLGVFVEADDLTLCLGESTTLHATAFGGGSSTYSYLWTANNSSWQSTQVNPSVTPESNTTYQVVVNDGFSNVSGEIYIQVKPLPQIDIVPTGFTVTDNTIFVCVRDSVVLDAGPNLSYLWMNGAVTRKQKVTTNGNWIDVQEWSIEVTDPQTGCKNRDDLIVFFDFNTCNIGLEETIHSHQLNIYPNPGSGHYQLVFKDLESKISLIVMASDGRFVLRQDQLQLNKAGTALQLDLTNQPDGLYFLNITDGHKMISRKLLKAQ